VERIAQILDDLDDLIYSIGLMRERFREIMILFLTTLAGGVLTVGGVLLALRHPPLAMATALLLFVSLLYRAVTSPTLEIA
jgi:hypothetical protein